MGAAESKWLLGSRDIRDPEVLDSCPMFFVFWTLIALDGNSRSTLAGQIAFSGPGPLIGTLGAKEARDGSAIDAKLQFHACLLQRDDRKRAGAVLLFPSHHNAKFSIDLFLANF